MAVSDRRARLKGRRENGAFALIPDDVLRHPATTSLSHAHLRILIVIAAQYRSSNNGALPMDRNMAREYGVNSPDTLSKALRALEDRGLIDRTHSGSYHPPEAARFAVTWKPTNKTAWSREGPATRRYMNWRAAA